MNQGNWYQRLSTLREGLADDPHQSGLEALRLFEDWLYEQAHDLGFPKRIGGMREYVDYTRKRGRLSRADSARAIRFTDVRNCVSHRSGLLVGPALAGELLDFLESLFRSDAQDAERLMTPEPHHVAEGDNLREVSAWMLEHGVSRVPVMRGSKIVGLLTTRDIVAIQAETPDDGARARLTVGETMDADAVEEVRFIPRRAPYDEVLAHLRDADLGCLLVTEHGREDEPLLGVITATDILPRL